MSDFSGQAYYYLVFLGLYELGCCTEKGKKDTDWKQAKARGLFTW